jgi:outer membrane protein assembly factor BamE (lipoprotein component of BamABCDE complex)
MRRAGNSAVAAFVLALAGCASYSGSHLVTGKSTVAEVEATMGAPTEKVEGGGHSIWFYSRQPHGRAIYAVHVSQVGIVQSVEQTLTRKNIERLRVGMSAREVRAIVGPPALVARMPRQGRDVWEYRVRDLDLLRLWVQLGFDGAVKEVYLVTDPEVLVHPGVDDDNRR